MVAPQIKLFDETGEMVSSIMLDTATGAGHGIPVVAVSNSQLLVLWPGRPVGRLYPMGGGPPIPVKGIDFTPISAVAISDGVWLVYGPEQPSTRTPRPAWLHCLYADAAGTSWAPGFRDTLRTHLSQALDGMLVAPSVTGDTVFFKHDVDGGQVLAGTCDNRPGHGAIGVLRGPFASTVHRVAVPAWLWPRTGQFLGGFLSVANRLALVSVDETPEPLGLTAIRERLGWLLWTDPDHQRRVTRFTMVSTNGREAVTVPGAYRVLDSRAGVGALIETDEPNPVLFVVSDVILSAALMSRDRRDRDLLLMRP